MIKFNFIFKIIKSKPKKYSLTKKAEGKKGKQKKQHGWKNGLDTWHVDFPKKPIFLGIKAKY